MIDTTNLEEKLSQLTGHDFAMAESAERNKGNMTPLMTFSSSFQTRLAAMALEVTPDDLKDLPLNEYAEITNRTANFLFGSSAKRKTPSES